MRTKFIAALLGIGLLLVACQAVQPTPADVPPTSTTAPVSAAPKGGGDTIPSTAAEVPRITAEELRALFEQGVNVTLIDTRSAGEYQTAHIPRAIHISYSDIESRYGEIPSTSRIVLYCA